MALWQFCFQLISASGEDFSPAILDNCNSIDIFRDELPRGQSWCKDIYIFGCEDTTCVELFVRNATIEDISVRIDIRSITKKQLSCIIEFAAVNRLKMLCKENADNKAQNVSLPNILDAIKSSKAYAFVKDPQTFLTEMRHQHMSKEE